MHVPFVDLAAQNRLVERELSSAVNEVVSRVELVLGPAVERFERRFAEYCGAPHCVGLSNGTIALQIALLAAGIGPGDEVITTPHTWISTAAAISHVGATPVFADIDPVRYTLDPAAAAAKITPRTKAVLPVHLYGQMADVAALRQLADQHELLLLEDAAQAHGAQAGGRRAGSWGQVGCFSFYPAKNLGCWGEAGALVTSDAALAERARQLRNHGQTEKHRHVSLGFNGRMESIQAAVLDVKLPHLDRWNARRREAASRYVNRLRDFQGLILPQAPEALAHVWHLFVVQLTGVEREEFQRALSARGIATQVHYPTPAPLQPCYAHLNYRLGDFPVAEAVMSRCVSLPIFETIRDDQVDAVCEAVAAAL